MSQHSVDFAPSLRQDVDIASDSLESMLERERGAYACRDYLRCERDAHNDGRVVRGLTASDRTKIVDWCYDIVDKLGFDRETVAVAMNLADRYAGIEEQVIRDRAEYQLVAVTSLYVSIKMHERVTFGSVDIAAATQGVYAVRDIEDTELRILAALGWRLCPPTSLQIAYCILSLVLSRIEDEGAALARGGWEYLRDEVAFGTESAVRDHRLATATRPSSVAAASIVQAAHGLEDRDRELVTTALLGTLNRFDFDSSRALLDSRERLCRLLFENEAVGVQHVATDVVSSESSRMSSPGSEATRIPSPHTTLDEFGGSDYSCTTAY